jgi:PAS domain S-box-containing protein
MARESESSKPGAAGTSGVGVREHVLGFDWSGTALGPLESWPQPLKVAVQIALDSAFPTYVWWGPQLIQIYNDAVAKVLGTMHPSALGQPARECWAALWPKVGPILEPVLATGRPAAGTIEVMFDRGGRPEPAWFDFCYGALRDEAGAVGGLFITAIETTQRVLAERKLREDEERQAFLLKLSDALRPLADPREIQGEATRLLREQFDVGWCYYLEFNADLSQGVALKDAHREGLPSLAMVHDTSDIPGFFEHLRSGQVLNVPDFASWPFWSPRVVERYSAMGVKSLLGAPLVKLGRLIALLVMVDTEARVWSESAVALINEVAERTWAALARARAEARMKESENRYRSLFDQTVAGIAESDLDGRIIAANDRYCEILGYDCEEILRRRMQDITHPEDLPGNLDPFRRCRDEGVPFEIEKRYIRKDGSVVWVHNSVSLVRDGQGRPKSVVAVVLDVSHRVLAEQALAEANRAKDQFLAMLGHELRNPLSPIVTTLQLMKLRAPDTLASERKVIEQQVHYISDMVDDLLDVARIVHGKVELKTAPVRIADIAASAIEAVRPLFEEHGQVLHTAIAEGLLVSGDRRRLVQVLVNLLANAAKYSPPGSTIRFSAAAEGKEAVLRVRDEGVGIDPALLPRVFELFTQDEQSIERSRGGLGLGLAIVRNLIEMHGGSVGASSAGRDRGSEFMVRLPLLERRAESGAESAPAVPAGGRATPRRQPIKVLIVDDYVLAADSLGALLRELGFDTRVAHDGASALDLAVDYRPDVALIDIGLPVMDGYEVARRLRSTPGTERMPLVALTGYGQESDRERVRQAGFDEHLVKPVNAERIGALIERLVAP